MSSLGKCVVCGKKTDKRCKPCADNGTDYIWLCSTECQRLVHFVHKRVCGKGHFEWPKLNQKEYDRYLELAIVPRSQTGGTQLDEPFLGNHWSGTREEQMEQFRNTLSAFRDDFKGTIAPADAINSGITSLRYQAALGEAEVAGSSGQLELGICTNYQLVDTVIGYEGATYHDLLWDDSPAWWSKYQHFMVILHAVWGRLGKESSEFEWTVRQMRDLSYEEMIVTHGMPGKMAFCVMHCIDSI